MRRTGASSCRRLVDCGGAPSYIPDPPGFAADPGAGRNAALEARPGPRRAPGGPRGEPPRCLVIGAGGLGAPVLLGLARAGIAVRVADDDVVCASNLQRQLLYRPSDVGRPKVQAAADRLRTLGGVVEPVCERFTASSAARLMDGIALVLDGCDDPATRFLANDACVLAGIPLVHGAALRFTGQVMTIVPRTGACLRCLFEGPPEGEVPTCSEAGVLGAICGVAGSLMVERATRVLAGEPLTDDLTIVDGLAGRVRAVPLRRDPACAVCGDAPAIRSLAGAA